MDNFGEVTIAVADESREPSFLKDFKAIQAENDLFLKGSMPSKCVEDILNDISIYAVNNPFDAAGMLRMIRCCAENSLMMLKRTEIQVKNLQQLVEINMGVLRR